MEATRAHLQGQLSARIRYGFQANASVATHQPSTKIGQSLPKCSRLVSTAFDQIYHGQESLLAMMEFDWHS